MSVTEKVKKLRAAKSAPVKLGQWHADFSTVKKYADANNVPLIAVWSNGDACGHCTTFENCILDTKFKNWQKTCGCAMWIGFGSDTSKEDKMDGTGYNFAWGPKKALQWYPFVRVYWKKGKVDVCKTGDDLDGGTSKGAAKVVKAFQSYLKNYKPEQSTSNTAQNTDSNGSCTDCAPFVPPVLSYQKDGDSYSLVVDGKPASGLSLESAKFICDAYAKGSK